MLKVYRYKVIFEDEEKGFSFVDHTGFKLLDKNDVQNETKILTWDEMYRKARQLIHFDTDYTFFKKRPYFSTCLYFNDYHRFYKSDKKFKLYTIYEEYNSLSLMEMMDKFPSNKMIQYLKEHGLNICPII